MDTTRNLIDSLTTKWRFTAGVLSWHPDDSVTPEQEQRVMDESSIGLRRTGNGSAQILWVRHRHAGHHELHFVIPRVELSTGKAALPSRLAENFDVFRDMHKSGKDEPDPTIRRAPEHPGTRRSAQRPAHPLGRKTQKG